LFKAHAQALYKPSPWQNEFHSTYGIHQVLGAGAAGPGKTVALVHDPLIQALTEHQRCEDPSHPYPLEWGASKGFGLHLRRHLPMLRETLNRARRIYPKIDPGVKFRENNGSPVYTFSSGYQLQFGHCNKRDDWGIYQGHELTWLGWDELTQFYEEQYHQVCARVRTDDPVLAGLLRIVAASNPVTRYEGMGSTITIDNPHWVREMFVEPAPDGRTLLRRVEVLGDGSVGEIDRLFRPATLADNPDASFRKQYELKLRGLPPHIRQAYLFGNWWITPGSYFGDVWDPTRHVIGSFRVPSNYSVWRSMDWGYKTHGCVHWWAMSPDGLVFCVREFTFRGMKAAAVAKAILEIEEDLGFKRRGSRESALVGPADTQLWEERGESVLSKAHEMAEVGVRWVPADKRSRRRNSQLLQERLESHEYEHGLPGVLFFSHCYKAIQTIPMIPRDEHDWEQPAQVAQDHWLDSVLYAMAFISHGAQRVPEVREHDDNFEDYDEPANDDEFGDPEWGYGDAA
jgi:hypothetical protein